MFNDEIAAAIREKFLESNYGELLAARGITTVALDENGDIVEHRRGHLLAPLNHQCPWCTTSSNGRRLGLRIGLSGRSAGYPTPMR